MSELKDFTGEKYKTVPLKILSKRLRNKKRKPENRQPLLPVY